jgi:hypothetical protein
MEYLFAGLSQTVDDEPRNLPACFLFSWVLTVFQLAAGSTSTFTSRVSLLKTFGGFPPWRWARDNGFTVTPRPQRPTTRASNIFEMFGISVTDQLFLLVYVLTPWNTTIPDEGISKGVNTVLSCPYV